MGRQPGHRQRGAGTITVSRGEVERQGVLVKEWQRTPMQLLHEYCQSKKRRNPFYPSAKAPEGKFSMSMFVLPQSAAFDTIDEAKHCAALLALHHVEPLRPFEQKLPDPYRGLWLAMTTSAAPAPAVSNGKKSKASSKKTGATATPAAAAAPAAAPKDENEMDFWANVPDSPKSKADGKTKSFPRELTADRKFASHAEFEKAKLEQVQARNKKIRQRENRERANLQKEVFMSAACRDMIENVLRQLGTITTTSDSADDASAASLYSAAATQDGESAHASFYESVTRQLKAIGFQQKHIQGALQACRKEPDHSDDEYMTIILDWLCLNVPEGDLPKGFNPEGTQLDVVLSTKTTESKADSEQAGTIMSSVLVQRLMKYGYDRRDAISTANEYLRSHPEDAGNESPSTDIMFALLQQLYPHQLKHFEIDAASVADGVPDDEELASMRQDEVFALEAIYEDRFVSQFLSPAADNGRSQVLVLQVSDDVQLEIFFPSGSKYPFELPVIGLTSSNPALQPYLLFTCGSVLKSCASTLGDPLIYDICVAVDTILGECAQRKNNMEKIVLLPHAKSANTKPSSSGESKAKSTPPPAPVAVASNSGSKGKKDKKQNANKKRFAEQKVDVDAMNRMSEKLLQLRRKKDSNSEFQEMIASRAKLPAAAEKENVIQYLKHNQVVLVCGQTGCGKTTQVPQFILDDYIDNSRGGECQIICTQPRRIAAIGVATRVAQERCEDIADIVGYQIRMDAKKSANTRLLFCTTGVLLRRLLTDRSLSGVSHVIVDEVHERNIDTDFLLSILRDLLPKRPDLRLILMSATMNSSLFVNYFAAISKSPCPVLDIPGFTYPVQCNFLEDVLAITSYDVPKKLLVEKKKKQSGGDDGVDAAREKNKRVQDLTPQELVEIIDDSRIDYDLVVHLVTHLVTNNMTDNGSILIFMPGTAEIKRVMEMLSHTSQIASKLLVLPLHGSLSGADQSLVFRPAPHRKTKIIVSTNIAETSITINDITVVVDCGKVKEMVYDNRQRRSQLLDCWAAQAACDQRKGRAGRVQAGTCYRLFSRKRFDAMEPQLSAEIHRVSLEQLCLQIKKLELGSIKGFLAKAIEPPKEEAIDAAMQELVEIAAFKQVSAANTTTVTEDEQVRLTPLGNHLAMLPLDARIGKFLVYGSILRCVEPVVLIAACISSKNPFLMSMSDPELKEKQESLKKELNGNWKSDHLLLWKVLERYAPLKGQKLKRGFCKDFGLSFDTMESIVDLKNQYLQQLGDIGFYDSYNAESLNSNSSVPRIIKAALCAGLYGNVAQVVYPEQKYFQSAHGVFTEAHDAKKIRYFIKARGEAETDAANNSKNQQRERVFLHPSSCNFVQTQYDSPWLLYTELVQTSKVFVRESTMVNPYALLLFGGKLEVVHEKNLLVLDKWIQFHAIARIGVLIKAIRKHLDQLLMEKIEKPALDIAQSELVTAISHLLKSEGM
ncbi:Atp-dependent RNA helicase, partial [Globisporangium splendens]